MIYVLGTAEDNAVGIGIGTRKGGGDDGGAGFHILHVSRLGTDALADPAVGVDPDFCY